MDKSITTKFLIILIVNFIIESLYYLITGYIDVTLYGFILCSFILIFNNLFYSLFVAIIWQILEAQNKDNSDSTTTLRAIAIACLFSTVIQILFFHLVHAVSKTDIIRFYLFLVIEIFTIYIGTKIVSFIGKNKDFVRKFAEFFDKGILFYIYLTVGACFLTWLPFINWDLAPFKIFGAIARSYLDLFRPLVPPIVGIDFSPIIAIAILFFVKKQARLYFADVLGEEILPENTETEDNNSNDENS